MSKREFVTASGMRQTTVNSRDKAEMEKAFAMLAEKLAPLVAELLEGKAPATNASSNGRKIRSSDLTSRYQAPDDEFDTLPDGDDAPARGGADQYELPD